MRPDTLKGTFGDLSLLLAHFSLEVLDLIQHEYRSFPQPRFISTHAGLASERGSASPLPWAPFLCI